MNIKKFKFNTIIRCILLVSATIAIDLSKQINELDVKPVSYRFADLLNSLVKVNVERVDSLKKLYQLYDVKGAKQSLRTQDDKDDLTPNEAMLFNNRDEYSDIINKPTVVDKKQLCFCRSADSDREDVFGKEFKERAVNRKSPYGEVNVRVVNDESSTDADQISFLPIDGEQLRESDKKNDPSLFSPLQQSIRVRLKSRKRPPPKAKEECLSSKTAYGYCKSACSRLIANSCAVVYCEISFSERLKKVCVSFCDGNF